MNLQQGACIRLDSRAVEDPAPNPSTLQLYQVIGVDQGSDRCWLRRWPLARQGSPVFEISLQRLDPPSTHRPLPPVRQEG